MTLVERDVRVVGTINMSETDSLVRNIGSFGEDRTDLTSIVLFIMNPENER